MAAFIDDIGGFEMPYRKNVTTEIPFLSLSMVLS